MLILKKQWDFALKNVLKNIHSAEKIKTSLPFHHIRDLQKLGIKAILITKSFLLKYLSAMVRK